MALSQQLRDDLAAAHPVVRATSEEHILIELPPNVHRVRYRGTATEAYSVVFPWTYCVLQVTEHYIPQKYLHMTRFQFSPRRVTHTDDMLYSPWLPNLYGGHSPCFRENGVQVENDVDGVMMGINYLVTAWLAGRFNNDDIVDNLFGNPAFRYLAKRSKSSAYSKSYDAIHRVRSTTSAYRRLLVEDMFRHWETLSENQVKRIPGKYWKESARVGTIMYTGCIIHK